MVTSAPSGSDFHRGEADQWLVAATSSPSRDMATRSSASAIATRYQRPATRSLVAYSFSPEMPNQSRPSSTPSWSESGWLPWVKHDAGLIGGVQPQLKLE